MLTVPRGVSRPSGMGVRNWHKKPTRIRESLGRSFQPSTSRKKDVNYKPQLQFRNGLGYLWSLLLFAQSGLFAAKKKGKGPSTKKKKKKSVGPKGCETSNLNKKTPHNP